MKILHVLPGFPLDYPGGITNYVRTLAESQLKAGDEVAVLTDSCDQAKRPAGLHIIQVDHSKLVNFSFRPVSSGKHSDGAIENIRQMMPEIVHFHTVYGLSMKFIRSFMALQIPYIVSLHDYYLACPRIFMMDKWGTVCRHVDLGKCSRCVGLLEQSNVIRIGARKLGWNLPTVRSSGSADRIGLLSPFMDSASALAPVSRRVEEIFRRVYPKARYRTITIGNSSADQPKVTRSPSSVVRASFLGTLNAHKGGNLFIELIDYCRKREGAIEFHFYGRMDPEFEQPLKERGVINHGSYKPSDMASIMAATDLGLVLPIWEDNGPQVVMEIINSGTPILATRVGGIPDFVSDQAGYLFHPDSEEEKAAAFEWTLQQTPIHLAGMGAATQRLKTPAEHALEIRAFYAQMVAKG